MGPGSFDVGRPCVPSVAIAGCFARLVASGSQCAGVAANGSIEPAGAGIASARAAEAGPHHAPADLDRVGNPAARHVHLKISINQGLILQAALIYG